MGFGEFFNNFFVSNKRQEFVEQANQTKERIAQSKLSAAMKKVLLAVIDYTLTTNNSVLVNIVTSDGDITTKRALLNKVLALSKLKDDDLLKEIKLILATLPTTDETWQALSNAVNDATQELQQRRDTAYKIAAAIAALGSLTFAYFNPLLGCLTIAAEIAVAYTQDLNVLKPYINEVNEIVECGIVLEAVVGDAEKARENLAMNTFKRKL